MARPTVVFPAPMSPTKNTLACASRACNGVLWLIRYGSCRSLLAKRLPCRACAPPLASGGGLPLICLNDARRNENSQFAALVAMRPMAEKRAQNRYFAQDRHPRHIVPVVGRINSADRHRTTILDFDARLHVFGVDRGPGVGLLADAVFGDVEVQHHPAVRHDLRLDLQFERGAPELHARHALPHFRLIRQLGALLDYRFHPVRRDDPRARDDFAAPLGFQRAQLDVQQPRRAGREQA